MADQVVKWAISHVSPIIKFIDGTTLPTDGFDVTWTTNTGLSGAAFVPKAQIGDIDAVNRAVVTQIKSLVAIHNLAGEHQL